MSEPLVSVAMATYNGAAYLEEQLRTIYAQTWRKIEVVVSDDASTDATPDILERYAASHGLRFATQNSRVGLVENFGRALSMAEGDFIALADQDDVWEATKIKRLLAAAGDGSMLVYCSPQRVLLETGAVVHDVDSDGVYNFVRHYGSGRPAKYLMAENWIVSHSMMIRREVVAAGAPVPREVRFHDDWFACVACSRGSVRFIDEPLQIYRRHTASLTFGSVRPRRRAWRELLSSRARLGWRSRAADQLARLERIGGLAGWSAAERRCLDKLDRYYRAGVDAGWCHRSLLAGLVVGGWFSTIRGLRRRAAFALRPLVWGRLSSRAQ